MDPDGSTARLRLRQRLHVERLSGPQSARRERARRHAPESDLHHAAALEGASIDVGNAGGRHPNGDETPNNDGWAAFSGTSASCPQVAGVCALIKQACPRLTPAEVKDILMRTARDVTAGRVRRSRDARRQPRWRRPRQRHRQRHGRRPPGRAPREAALPKLPLIPFTPAIPFSRSRRRFLFSSCRRSRPRDPAATRRAHALVPVFVSAIPLQPAFPLQPFQPALPVGPVGAR